MTLREKRGTACLLGFLLVIDILLVGIHYLSASNPALWTPEKWSIEADTSFGELFQHLKWASMSGMTAYLAWKIRGSALWIWSFLFLYFLVDDRFRLHERIGMRLSKWFEMPSSVGLKPHDFGELLVSATVGAVFLCVVAPAYWRACSRVRRVFVHLASLLMLLALFGVGIDALHSATYKSPTLFFAFGVLEDGGEMIIASVMAAYAVSLCFKERKASSGLPGALPRP